MPPSDWSKPVVLQANLPSTFYRGAGRISSFRGLNLPDRPEDWVGSCTTRFGSAAEGLSSLPDGTLLRDAITADPTAWLGTAATSVEPRILVKLLDTGQRIPVHAHPNGAFARQYLGASFGKTEAWVVLEAEPGAEVYLGFREALSFLELLELVERQGDHLLLNALNRIPVSVGDSILCPAGAPHSIGPGLLLLEIQEPSDFSVMLERNGFLLDKRVADLGLTTELALSCVDRSSYPPDRIARLRGDSSESIFASLAPSFFDVSRVHNGFRGRGFAILIVVSGHGFISADMGIIPIKRGTTIVLPYAAGEAQIIGDVDVYWCTAGTA